MTFDITDILEQYDSEVEYRDDDDSGDDDFIAAVEELASDVTGGTDPHDLADFHFIHEDDFEEYARELAEDVYDLPDPMSNYIDWEQWARDLRMDYTEYGFNGSALLTIDG
jgi:antirestriction protein